MGSEERLLRDDMVEDLAERLWEGLTRYARDMILEIILIVNAKETRRAISMRSH